jgi:eukaryotic-like serine/threonine-protein kinase
VPAGVARSGAGGGGGPGRPAGAPGGPGWGPTEGVTTRRRSGAYVVVLLVMLVVLGGLLFLLGKQLGVFDSTASTQVSVPTDIVGEQVAAATTELQAVGLKANPSSPTGTVTGSSPAPGATTTKGQTVNLTVTPPPAQIDVPSVINVDQQDADNTLQNAGFVLGTPVMANSTTVTAGNVISQDPPGGASSTRGATVTLTISLGQAQVAIPSEVGQDPSVAGAALGALGFKVTSSSEASNTEPSGRVTRTNPPAGTMVPMGASVTIYVSTGAQNVAVPSEDGQTEAAATAALQAAGFTVATTNQATSNPAKIGVVLSQNPTGSAPKGATVTIVVGVFGLPSTTNPSATTTTTTGQG